MLPEKFLNRMKAMLGEDFPAFSSALEEPAVRAIRVNECKCSAEQFLGHTSLSLESIPYADCGFIPEGADKIGKSAEHHAGLFYVQDPGAMATVSSINIIKGWKVLDACAAPGGKSSQLAAAVGEGGFLLSNEFVPKRAKIIVGNFERLGIKNAVVTSLDTAEFNNMFSAVFDLVLCDAPCSGEGMFRKYDVATEEWSEENVAASAARQREILENCSAAVRDGGYLLYSTCTYSEEENEGVIADFLKAHPDFSLAPVREEVRSVTAPGITRSAAELDMSEARRFYPHLSKGEGQFIALMKRENSDLLSRILYKENIKKPSKDEILAVERFFSENFSERPSGHLIKQGEGISLIMHDFPIPPCGVFMPGIMLGEVAHGMLTPHHNLFSALGALFKKKELIAADDKRLEGYLRGEQIEARTASGSGYVAVCLSLSGSGGEAVPLGGGKLSSGKINNRYPKGLRNK